MLSICPKARVINTDPYILQKFISGIQHHLNIGPGIYLLNREIRRSTREKNFDIVFVDNKSYLSSATIRYIKKRRPQTKVVNLLTDDPFGKFSKSWRLIKQTAYLYDLIFVQREVNIREFKNLGAQHVEICYRSFDPYYNRPILLDAKEATQYYAPVGFVGTYENVRASYIAFLIGNNVPVSVTGNDWPNGEYWDVIKPYYKGPSVFEDEYIKAINGMEVALHFLRHGNRDEQDSRTFEIPACQVFMIAERSDLHSLLFKENEEAVFFSTKEELLEKVKFYIAHEAERKRIALNGYNRCFTSGYTHEERMKAVLEMILKAEG